jgi:hypothetical protein
VGVDLEDARFRVRSLRDRLREITGRDPEQEVRGIALPVVDSVLYEARKHIKSDDPVVEAISGLVTAETIAEGEPIRAVDALLVADQLLEALNTAAGISRETPRERLDRFSKRRRARP